MHITLPPHGVGAQAHRSLCLSRIASVLVYLTRMTDEFDPDQTDPDTEVLAHLSPAPGRWWFGIGIQFLLGVLLLYIALAFPPRDMVFQVVLIAIAAATLLLAERGRRMRLTTIYLGRQGLWDSEGRWLARLEQIRTVDRGPLAFKPSNGFLLRLTDAPGRVWVPGLWWRIGRSVGVGGTTPAGASKFMGEMVATLLKEREYEQEQARRAEDDDD